MRAVLQRVTQSSLVIGGETIGEIAVGIMALIGIGKSDHELKIDPLLDKITTLRIFPNEQGRFDKSLSDIGGELMIIPQFTLFADTSKGRRPEFFDAMPPESAAPLFDKLIERARERFPGSIVSGVFGADMKIALVNDGPVTITLEI